MLAFFSNRLGCVGSLLVSLVETVLFMFAGAPLIGKQGLPMRKASMLRSFQFINGCLAPRNRAGACAELWRSGEAFGRPLVAYLLDRHCSTQHSFVAALAGEDPAGPRTIIGPATTRESEHFLTPRRLESKVRIGHEGKHESNFLSGDSRISSVGRLCHRTSNRSDDDNDRASDDPTSTTRAH